MKVTDFFLLVLELTQSKSWGETGGERKRMEDGGGDMIRECFTTQECGIRKNQRDFLPQNTTVILGNNKWRTSEKWEWKGVKKGEGGGE